MSPQALDALREMLTAASGSSWAACWRRSRARADDQAFHGRMYINLSQMRHVVSLIGAALADMLRSLGHSRADRSGRRNRRRAAARRAPARAPRFRPIVAHDRRAPSGCAPARGADRARSIARLTAVDPRTLSIARSGTTIEWWLELGARHVQIVFVMSSVLMREDALRKACRRVGIPYDALVYPAAGRRRAVGQHPAGDRPRARSRTSRATSRRRREYLLGGRRHVRRLSRRRWPAPRFSPSFDRFLDQYGHRGRYESDWAMPRLHEDPAPVLFAIRGQLRRPAAGSRGGRRAPGATTRPTRGARSKRALTGGSSWTLLPRVRAMLRRLKKQYVWREQVRSDLTRVLRQLRRLAPGARRSLRRARLDRSARRLLPAAPRGGRRGRCADPARGPGLRDDRAAPRGGAGRRARPADAAADARVRTAGARSRAARRSRQRDGEAS